jgi:hypothetical protein
MRRLVLAVGLALLQFLASAQQPQNGQPAAEAPNRKAADGFSAQLYVISNFSAFIKDWTATSPEHVPRIKAVSAAKRGDALAITVFFTRCKVDIADL